MNELGHPTGPQLIYLLLPEETGSDDDFYLGSQTAQFFKDLITAAARQVQVHDHQINGVARIVKKIEGLIAVLGHQDLKAKKFQEFLTKGQDGRVIIHEQNKGPALA